MSTKATRQALDPQALDRQALGAQGEELAARHLRGAGLEILARNWRCREGEIDIVARDGTVPGGEVLVICEVKTRRGVGFGTPLEAVTPAKAARLRRLAGYWLAAQRVEAVAQPRTGYAQIRFDVVSVLQPPGGHPVIEHLRGAF
jgi:putative endonuclease